MAQVTEQQIMSALSQVLDEEKGQDIVSLGMVTGLKVQQGHVAFAIQVEPERAPDSSLCEKRLNRLSTPSPAC